MFRFNRRSFRNIKSLEFRLEAAIVINHELPPQGGTPNFLLRLNLRLKIKQFDKMRREKLPR